MMGKKGFPIIVYGREGVAAPTRKDVRRPLAESREIDRGPSGALAARAGLTQDGVHQLESGRRRPAWQTVLALGKALGVPCTAFEQQGEAAEAPEPVKRPGKPREAPAVGHPGADLVGKCQCGKLVDVIALVRHAVEPATPLVPFTQTVEERYGQWWNRGRFPGR
jgi:transcriptional regulator with XRE-family HTH domain